VTSTVYRISASSDPYKGQQKITMPFRKLGTLSYDPNAGVSYKYLDGPMLEISIPRVSTDPNYNPREHEPLVDPDRIKWMNWAGAITDDTNKDLIMENIKFFYIRTIEI